MQKQTIFNCLNQLSQNDNSNISQDQQDQVFKQKVKPNKKLSTCIQEHVLAQHNFPPNQQYSQSYPCDLPQEYQREDQGLQFVEFNPTQNQNNQVVDAFNNERETHPHIRIPLRVVKNPKKRKGTYKRKLDSIWNSRYRQVCKLLLKFSCFFKIPPKMAAKWHQILKNPACKDLNLLLKKLVQFEKSYMKNPSKCQECPGFLEHLGHTIQGECMIEAMRSAFEDDEEARWDCAYVYDFCLHARQNAQLLQQGKKRSSLVGNRKLKAYQFVRKITN